MATFELKSLVKSYGKTNVIHGIDLFIPDGEFVVFVGPSGCGKSTTLRMIAGLEEVSGGEILIGGRVVNEVDPKQRNLAMVFQNYAIFPHMTVRQNIAFGVFTSKLSKTEKAQKVDEAAALLGLTALLDRRPSALSGGQRQRVAIGRAMVRDPAGFLFDEPLSNLDAALRVATRIEIAQLKEAMPDRTMIYVTHDQVEAMTLASRIVVLADKGIAQVGTPLELYERPETEFVAQFIGSPSMNLIAGEIIATGAVTKVRVAGGEIEANIPTRADNLGLKVNVGVRPEDMVPCEDGQGVYSGEVDIVEALGEVTLLYFGKEGVDNAVIAKLPGIHTGLRHQKITLKAAPDKIHLFAHGRSLLYR